MHNMQRLTALDQKKTRKKSGAINGRIPADLRERLDKIGRKHRVTDAAMLEDALTAMCDLVEQTGHYESPMTMQFASWARQGVNESGGDALSARLRALVEEELTRRGAPTAQGRR